MLAILVSARCERVLVVVPTDALRTQIADKFLTLGALKDTGCAALAGSARHPIVAVLRHVPREVSTVEELFAHAQVVVTTSSIAGQCTAQIRERMADLCPYLFIDEAHHTEAPTWKAFKAAFESRRVLQFTATPFREDGKALDGKIIFNYPLKKAQQDGYFKRIHFRPVTEFNRNRSDAAIASEAVAQLRTDAAKGHILMARVQSVARAEEIFSIYQEYSEFKPVQLHTGIKSARQRDAIRKQLLSGESRIVVCVDMLGEGFDLPELKIAAFHDIRKSLAVTLQLAGRFTRSRPDLGDAVFVANTADVEVQEELRKLYARDPDWNTLLPELSDGLIGDQMSLQDFLGGFTDFTKEIPLKAVRPAISTVVYRTKCEQWTPENFRAGLPAIEHCAQVHDTINHEKHTLVVVTARRVPLEWTDVETLFSWQWELYVVVWSPKQRLLYINSSMNAGEYKALAQAIAGKDVDLVRGQQVFRTFAEVGRLHLQNVGLTEQLGRNVRYTGRMGSDVEPAVSDLQRGRARKSVLSGTGYECGQRVAVGASQKGRIWSHKRGRVDELAAWCKRVGKKLLDEDVDPDEVLSGTLHARTITERPARMPIGADWPEEMYRAPESMWTLTIGEREYQLCEVDINTAAAFVDGPLRLGLTSDDAYAELELGLHQEGETPNYRFVVRDGAAVGLTRRGGRKTPIEDFFYENPPVIWFADGSALEGNQYVELRTKQPPYDASKILALDWSGVNLRKESQGVGRDADSIQAHMIRHLRKRPYTVIFDDDGKGEAADIVTIRLVGSQTAPESIEVEFYHCKYSQKSTAGRRIKDLYEVCGQAQRSVSWMSSPEKRIDIFTHLMRREALRESGGLSTRFETGDGELLRTIREMSRLCRVDLSIFVVQPGISKSAVTEEQLRLLGVTENYLYETYQLSFGVLASL
ncbi:MAG: DEAD/DEAH box helicase family protein [Gammaproteobacteria bacterium]|nr:DEAD/DEAH box helicase family protein [Gammaproteobacteria bacterium]